jgi:hypothetical protein
MTAPAVAVTPVGPWAHTQEDAVVEVPRPVKSIRRAGVWGIVVVAVGAFRRRRRRRRRRTADADDDLRVRGWRQNHARQQCRGTEQRFEPLHNGTSFQVSAFLFALCVECFVAVKNSPPTAATIRIPDSFPNLPHSRECCRFIPILLTLVSGFARV